MGTGDRGLPAVSGLGRPPDRPVLPIAVNADSLATWFVDLIAEAAADAAALPDRLGARVAEVAGRALAG